jgi:Glycosyltransferase family 87
VIAEPRPAEPVRQPFGRARILQFASYVVFAALPAITVLALFATAIEDDSVAVDFRVFYDAAEAVLAGDSPYQALDDESAAVARGYVYPPITAIGVIPLTLLPVQAAGLFVMALLVCAALAVPWVLGVRDWRCYGLLLLWPPILSAVQTGSVTLLLALGAALAWRYRARTGVSAVAVGSTLSVKLILWPLVVWMAATRRVLAAVTSVAIGAAIVLGSWAAIGFTGLVDYPDVLRRLQDVVELDSYTVYVVALDAGASTTVARALWLAVGIAVLAWVVVAARRGRERQAFVLAVAAALLLTPIVWLHYFALLLVVVAVARPTLSLVWFVPLGMVITPGSGQPTPFQTSATLAIAATTVGLSLWLLRDSVAPVDLRGGRDLALGEP